MSSEADNQSFKNILEMFIDRNWNSLPSYAWRKFQEEGRGVVLYDFTRASLIIEEVNVPLAYLSFDEAVRQSSKPEELAAILNSYDAEREFVLAAVQPDVGTRFAIMRSADRLTPREAFEAGHAPRRIDPSLN
jgi:hypothetical protein